MDTALNLSRLFQTFACVLLLLTFWTKGVTPLEAPSPCLSGPCQHGAECRDDPSHFLCQCQSALSGPRQPALCQANASCQPTGGPSRELACRCEPDASGRPCRSRVQLCAQGNCGVDAQCRGLSGFVCVCPPGYRGALCQEAQMDECSPNPCRNRAICRNHGDGPTCFCVPGFQGERCEIEVNECISQPCQNGGVCSNRIGRYTCICRPGYTGAHCEVEIDECQSQPCLHGASCHDNANGFSCTCVAGFQGDRCEINIDECDDQPCQNGAACIDGLNSYRCDCSGIDFVGPHCTVPIPPCRHQPCVNGALCLEEGRNYTCECLPGFQGYHCEEDVNECGSSPCLHGSECIELSWQHLYGAEPLLPVTYDPGQAAGYICRCMSGLRGAFCEEDVNECDAAPCQNGGSCQNTVGGYICHCPPQNQDGVRHGGRHCEELLLGCQTHECQNEASCVPFLSQGRHGYGCSCRPGYTGSHCQTPTGFSFETPGGYLRLQTPLLGPEASSNISLSFRTALASTLLFQRGGNGGPQLTLELVEGRVRLSLSRTGAARLRSPRSWMLQLPQNVTDGGWHTVRTVLGDGVLVLHLLDPCEGEECESSIAVDVGTLGPQSALHSTLIGGLVEGGGTWNPGRTFIGCMKDLFVDSQLMVPEDWLNTSAVRVTHGCSDRDWCLDSPCENRGKCVNLWQGYRCKCQRPYEGQNCTEEHITARFGSNDAQSFAKFRVSGSAEDELSVSAFVRTRRQTGLLLLLANSTSQYLRLWLDHGQVVAQVRDHEVLRSSGFLSDGESRFLSVSVRDDRMSLWVSGQGSGPAFTRGVRVQPGDVVYVGGLWEAQSAAAFGGYFKGCIQDLRLNGRYLPFFPLGARLGSHALLRLESVTRGCTSDDICMKSPCENGGMCYSVWDDFTCTCPPNTAGRRCEEVKWCDLSPCPSQATCLSVDQGYECISNATFLDDVTFSYRGNGAISRNLTSISFSLRTRLSNAALLHAETVTEFMTVSVQDGLLLLELQSGAAPTPLSLHSPTLIADGDWHSVELHMVSTESNASRWILMLDGDDRPVTSNGHAGNLDFLREGVDILLGGLGPDAGWNLIGCLSSVLIGGIALPYYGAAEVRLPRPQAEQFVRTSDAPVRAGCGGADVCLSGPCLNQGVCRDAFNLVACVCPPGWAGELCQIPTDTCASDPCLHGNCSVRGLAYECACTPGHKGQNCEIVTDVCEEHKCAHGGTCLRGVESYACLCNQNYTGPYCNEVIEEVPWYITVKDVRPKLPVSICGDERHNYTCFNGGNCTDTDLTCACQPGFTGLRCERDIDECVSNPCQNGGYCRNMFNRFHCVCDMSFAGERCEVDLNAGGRGAERLLWGALLAGGLLLLLGGVLAAALLAASRRATHGTYSPSRQEKEGSRVEMWNIVQPPPTERLI